MVHSQRYGWRPVSRTPLFRVARVRAVRVRRPTSACLTEPVPDPAKIVTQAKLWAFVAVMAFQFAVFETGLRLKGGSEAAPAFQRLFMPDTLIGYRLKPGTRTHFKTASFETDIFINSSGTRDDEIGPKAPGERRIVVLGDSIVMSVQVPLEQTFCRRLEQSLNRDARPPDHYRVINAGVQGYGPVEEALFYDRVASAFDADVVLVALFVGNDAVEALDQAWRLDSVPAAGGHAAASPPIGRLPTIVGAWVRRTLRRSMVLQIVRLRVRSVTDRYLSGDPGIDRPLTAYLPAASPDIVRGLAVTRQCVSRIAALAAAHGAKTAVVLLPARFQVNDADFANMQFDVAQRGETLLRNAASDRFKAALAGLPLPVMDALPPLFDAPRRSETFFEDTVHLTPRGHQIVADALERFLRQSSLLPTPGSSPVVTTAR